ncbi:MULTISPECIES: secreted protein/lipoprotein [unclassified Streptomyces]|uniref:secreted protein/lipoprotein n=1 Tax=unclassified Streptomyces TaxID=2593676 RepID=UPI000C06D177|nr:MULTISPECIES: secreted protein/lipoprotein [unclassified Streptomyces]MYQ39846.1 secreted protein/lipoprotein [Streptomyces sp. SID4921]
MVTARQKRARAGAVLRCGAATCALVLAGCGSGADDREDAKPSAGAYAATTTTTPGASAAHGLPAPGEAEDEVLKAYGSMWAERTKAYRAASAEGADLKLYLTPSAWAAVEADLDRMNRERTQMRGDLRHDPEVTTLATAERPPTATVRDCVDPSAWQTLDTTTGWRLPPPAGRPARYVATARLEHKERWTVTEYAEDRTRSC